MTTPCLSLESVSFVLPDGRTLFSGLTETFDGRRTGLVGRNGAGKTVLARLLAGQLEPAAGRCVRTGRVHYLPQWVTAPARVTVAGLAGLAPVLAALERIEAGSTAAADFELLADRWDIRQRLQLALARAGLPPLAPGMSASVLSGGEAMRVALCGAMLSGADFLVLDEPSNHLDRPNRAALVRQLQQWRKGLLVISHDRQLLESMDRVVELSPLGLRSYGGGYSFYRERKAAERGNALQALQQRKHERKREAQAMREQRERQDRRQAQGRKLGRESNQAKILLGRQKERSENSAGKLRRQHAGARAALDQAVRDAAQEIGDDAGISLHALDVAHVPRCVAELADVELPCVPAATARITLALSGQQRVGVVGPNGCGKSTLLNVLAGRLRALRGSCHVPARAIHLDQRLANLSPAQTALEQLLAANANAGEDTLRMQLAQLGLGADRIAVPVRQLSGGEQLKAALACALYADPPAQLLLLDEPANHLDLPSLQALEVLLRAYRGAIVVVSHDDAFLGNLGLTHRLVATREGWRMEAW